MRYLTFCAVAGQKTCIAKIANNAMRKNVKSCIYKMYHTRTKVQTKKEIVKKFNMMQHIYCNMYELTHSQPAPQAPKDHSNQLHFVVIDSTLQMFWEIESIKTGQMT